MESFREKTGLLRQSSGDIRKLMREGYDRQKAYEAAMSLFGTNRVKFVAIDGTESEDREMDMLVFYAGAVWLRGQTGKRRSNRPSQPRRQ
jgi:hypothetical protein